MANDKSLKVKNGLSAKRYMQGSGTATASSTSSGPVDAFSTDLYTGDGTTNHKITTNIDLSTDGGLVWIKRRSDTSDHKWMDTVRGTGKTLSSSTNGAQATEGSIGSFDTDGFTINSGSAYINAGSSTYVAWTFKKETGFFDVLEIDGSNGSGYHDFSHNLGSNVGAIIVKRYDAGTENWMFWHRTFSNDGTTSQHMKLNLTAAIDTGGGLFGDNINSSTFEFQPYAINVTSASEKAICYLFGHGDDIQCGNYTGTGTTGNTVNVGFQPQWLLIKQTNNANEWFIWDAERGSDALNTGNDATLLAAKTNAEATGADYLDFTSTGFTLNLTGGATNASGSNYIYIAIREGSASYSQTIDLSTGHYFSVTMSNPTTFSFTNPPASGVATSFVIELNNNESAITWPSSVKWAGGEAPAATSTKDIYKFITTDGGTTYYGALSGGAMA